MLFNAPEFLLAFLPTVVVGFFLLARLGRPSWAAAWLVVASLFFYAWWRLDFLPLLLLSVLFNFAMGRLLVGRPSRWLLGAEGGGSSRARAIGVKGVWRRAGHRGADQVT